MMKGIFPSGHPGTLPATNFTPRTRKIFNDALIRHSITPRYDFHKVGVMCDVGYSRDILRGICSKIERDTERLMPKVEQGLKWAAEEVQKMNGLADMICDAWSALSDVSDYPGSLRRSLHLTREARKMTLAYLIEKHIRQMQGKPYGMELAMKANLIDSSMTMAGYYISKVLAYFPNEKENTL